MENQKSKTSKGQPAKPAATARPPAPVRVPPLFRKLDWLAMVITFAVIWTVYFLTLAPEVTLEDSGELCTGSFYAGIPHPPGYPFWAIYSWLWTKLLLVGNVAWRVEVGESTAAALACGLVALMISRGSSMLMEGIEELRNITRQWESAICMVSGIVAGLLLGLGGVMWSESVAINRISPFGVPWMMTVLACLLRWIYAPHQRRYLYIAMFFFGICATIHQTLIVAAMGIEVAIAATQPRLGRHFFLGNGIIFVLGLILQSSHFINMLDTAQMVLVIYYTVGIGSIAAYFWLAVFTKETFTEFCCDGLLAASVLLSAFALSQGAFFILLALVAFGVFLKLQWDSRKLGLAWLVVIGCGFLWILGASFYFYEPIAGMTDPPMQWGYPRTVEGFFHALSRGQYEKASPSDIVHDPSRFIMQMGILVGDIASEFNWVLVFVALVPLLFYFKMQKRERSWIIGLVAIYLCIGVLLMILMNVTPDRQTAELNKVFFITSHGIVAIMAGYGMALIAAFMATHYQGFRRWGLLGGAVAALLGIYCLWDATGKHYFGFAGQVGLLELPHWIRQAFAKDQGGLPIYANLILAAIPFVFLFALFVYRNRGPVLITLALFATMPLYSGLGHWAHSEQRKHWYGYWFGHDMFTPPFPGPDGKLTYDPKLREAAMKGPNGNLIYPEMAKDTILFGGTDPGRFCPTYMIFCESFIPHDCQPLQDQNFDRRDVYLITQNALADGTYLNYLRAQYFRSQQIDPPFFSELARTLFKDDAYKTNFLARIVSPLDWYFEARGARIEKRWRVSTSWFTGTDFINLPELASQLHSSQDPLSRWLFQQLDKPTQDLITGKGDENKLRSALAESWNRLLEGPSIYEPARFAQVKISDYLQLFIAQNPQGDTRIRLNRLLLEAAYPADIAKSPGGVYPDREIYIPSPEDSQHCFQDYMEDVQHRMQTGQMMPNEDVKVDSSGRMQISGQVAVMMINGLLCKVIFDHNPKNEFYIEESFPLPWMYPYETPYSVIMKINRNPLPELPDEVFQRDHAFWSKYSDRLIGNWITYDTSVKDVVDFIEKVYLRHDYSGFKGDLKFVRDEQAQKAFSKLRSSIAGVYAWRISSQCPEEYRQKTPAATESLRRETEFAFKQAFAYCPYSPEAVFRYINFLLQYGRAEDALLVAQTCLKLDPYNDQVKDLVKRLSDFNSQAATRSQIETQVQRMENEVRTNPADLQNLLSLANIYLQMQQTNRAIELFDRAMENPHLDTGAASFIAQQYAQMGNLTKLEAVIEKLVALAPNQPEPLYDLAALDAVLGKQDLALQNLHKSLDLSAQRLKTNPKARDLLVELKQDHRFDGMRNLPAFQQMAPAQ